MLNLTPNQKESIGINFILNQLRPLSPYGLEKKAALGDFVKNENDFENIEQILNLEKNKLDDICGLLSHLKNIRGAAKKCETIALSEVELFEVKGFLLILEKLACSLGHLAFKGITITPMPSPLTTLDPSGQKLTPFSLSSPALTKIRKEKTRLEALNLLEERAAIVAAEDAEETAVMEELSAALRPHLQDFNNNMDNLGKLDLTIAKAKLAAKYDATRPMLGQTQVILQEMENPYISETTPNFTKISMTLPPGATIITGANMGGKSVAVKTTLLNITLSQMGFFVFAKTAQMPYFDNICFVSEDTSSTQSGLSTFAAEITQINEIIPKIRHSSTFLAMDEPARGTNPKEATAIVKALAAFLAEQTRGISLITTHYDGIPGHATAHYQISNYAPQLAAKDAPIPQHALEICKRLNLDQDLLAKIEENL
ncbi:MAG: hypothetical protein FWC67_04580 [Defluviitaleaceae bacterium]|nr:hypothetical protein [Defluviitaleaceae bacterium]